MNEDDQQQQQQNNPDKNLLEDKDQMIAYFQDLTSIDDTGECLTLLEAANWNLDMAVQSYYAHNELMQQENQQVLEPLIEDKANSTDDLPTNIINEFYPINNFQNLHPSTSHHQMISSFQSIAYTNFLNESRRFLEFEIEFKSSKKYFRIPDTATIEFLKKLCESEFEIPYEQLVLKGWKERDPSHLTSTNVDQVKLRELHLPLKTTLYLFRQVDNVTNPPTTSPKSPLKIHPSDEQCTYEIFIHVDTSINRKAATTSANCDKNFYALKYDSNKAFSKVKQDLNKLTNIGIKSQVWFWKIPEEQREAREEDGKSKKEEINEDSLFITDNLIKIPKTYDNSFLYNLKQYLYNLYTEKYNNNNKGSNIFKLEFYVEAASNEGQNKGDNNSSEENTIVVDEDEDDNEEDDFNFQPVNRLKRKTLISDEYKCEYEAVEEFNKEFSERYGSLIPLFFLGSLEDAIKESLLLPASDRKLLAIYLHSDSTIYSNIFCSTALCSEETISYLSLNFVLWPWDITLQKNEEYFYSLCLKQLGGHMVISTIKKFKSRLPALILLTRVRGNNEIIALIEGGSTKENLLMTLMQSDELFQQQRGKDIIDEKQREDREKIKREQDAAYQASLDYDKAKRQKQEEEISKEIEIRREQEKMKQRLETEFNEKKILYGKKLRPEPELTSENSKQLTTIRVKEIDGKILQRRFNMNDSLEQFIYYLGSLGYFIEKYKLLTTWPKRDLASEAKEKSFKELKLYPQETIILEERDE